MSRPRPNDDQLLTSGRAILDSRNNLANQEIFRIAKVADPDGHRTIGIMTKLDALQRGDEAAVRLFLFFCFPNLTLPRR